MEQGHDPALGKAGEDDAVGGDGVRCDADEESVEVGYSGEERGKGVAGVWRGARRGGDSAGEEGREPGCFGGERVVGGRGEVEGYVRVGGGEAGGEGWREVSLGFGGGAVGDGMVEGG